MCIRDSNKYYLAVRGCRNGDRIVLSKKAGLNTRFYFGDGNNGYKTLHSALCGDNKAVDLAGGSCKFLQPIFMWNTHGGNNQQWKLDDDGFLRVGISPCKFFFDAWNMVPLSLGEDGLVMFPEHKNDVLKWRFKDEKTLSIREMTCTDVNDDAGLEVHAMKLSLVMTTSRVFMEASPLNVQNLT